MYILSYIRRVNTLSWDAEGSVLYMGGSFYAIDSNEITPGLAMWTEQTGRVEIQSAVAYL